MTVRCLIADDEPLGRERIAGILRGIPEAAIVGLCANDYFEDNGTVGGCGSSLLQTLNEARVATPMRIHGIPQEFLAHAKRAAILERVGLTAQTIARSIVEDVTALDRGDSLVDIE